MYHFIKNARQLAPPPTSLGVATIYCDIGKRCATPAVKADAEYRCTSKSRWGAPPNCAELSQFDGDGTTITEENKRFFSPCEVYREVPVCAGTVTPQYDPGPSDPEPAPMPEEEDEDNLMMVGGIVAALILAGGIGYAVLRKKKKKKR